MAFSIAGQVSSAEPGRRYGTALDTQHRAPPGGSEGAHIRAPLDPERSGRASLGPELLGFVELGHRTRAVARQVLGEPLPVGVPELDLLRLIHHWRSPGRMLAAGGH